MCSHFQLPPLHKIEKYLKEDLDLPLVPVDFPKEEFKDATEIFPKRKSLVLLYQDDKLQLQIMDWGYPSPFKPNQVLNNARVERFFEPQRSMWDKSFARQRCIVLTNQFFESSRNTYTLPNGKTYHEEFSFKSATQPLTMIAAIYDEKHFALVTTDSNETVLAAHPRMPLVITPNELRKWLFQNFTSLIDRKQIKLTRTLLPHRESV